MIASGTAEVYADGLGEAIEVNAGGIQTLPAKSCALMEVSTGKLLYAMNEHDTQPPASITKIMTLLLVMEALENQTISLDEMVTVSAHASSMGGSQIWLAEGEQMSVDDLLKATVVASANDAAVALAELVAGSEDVFVEMMNRRAQELGMRDTVFKNASGLDEEGHVSSAYDIAIMSCALLRHEKIKEYSTIWMDSLRNGETALVNTNKLVRFYDGCTGLKTGTTNDAGSCLSASAVRDGMELVAVSLGSANNDERFSSGRALLDYGFANFSIYTPEPDLSMLTPVPVQRGVSRQVAVYTDGLAPLVIPKGMAGNVQQEIRLIESVEAPVEEGQPLGRIRFVLNGEELANFTVRAAEPVEKMHFSYALQLLWKQLNGADIETDRSAS
ncbi:MAG TPA: D-alanyl-D-alanine carboxypeptidase [Firmicutes bacterium]|nr:D-alanyl-D-alanine carboxypeptidase [Bacillota bacterium]